MYTVKNCYGCKLECDSLVSAIASAKRISETSQSLRYYVIRQRDNATFRICWDSAGEPPVNLTKSLIWRDDISKCLHKRDRHNFRKTKHTEVERLRFTVQQLREQLSSASWGE